MCDEFVQGDQGMVDLLRFLEVSATREEIRGDVGKLLRLGSRMSRAEDGARRGNGRAALAAGRRLMLTARWSGNRVSGFGFHGETFLG